MKYSKRYIIFTVVLIASFLIKITSWSDDYAQVEQFRGAQLEDRVFYPLKAASVNEERLLTATVDGEAVTNGPQHLMVNEKMEVMADIYFVQETFDCSVKVYDKGHFLLKRGEDTGTFFLKQTKATYNGEAMELSHEPMQANGYYYLPLQDLATLFGYSYSWDKEAYVVALEATEDTTVKLPSKYDLRDYQRTSQVRNQGNSSTCWAQASIGAIESSLLPQEEVQFEPSRMIRDNSFGLKEEEGGDYAMASAYLLAWQGPVQSTDGKRTKHVQEVHYYTESDTEKMKWAIYQYGGVTSSLYADVEGKNINDSTYYNQQTDAYCYTGVKRPNHDIVIIGWDDAYAAANFNGGAYRNGAWICQNSWGKDFGDQGVFYVSYSDVNIGSQCVSYAGVESADNYDNIYQSDLCGWTGQVGYGKDHLMAANVYKATANEKVEACGFYATDVETNYQVYFVSDFTDVNSLANRSLMAEGTLDDKGYYTIQFKTPQQVSQGQNFAVVISITTPGTIEPMAIEYQADDRTANVDISDGVGFISTNGLDWEDVETKAKGNLCLKAYSKTIKEKGKEE